MALSRIPQFRPVTPEEASPLYAAVKSFIPMYQQAQQMQMQKRQQDQQSELQKQKLGLQDQLAQMQMARQQQQIDQSQQRMQQQDVLRDQFSQLMGSPGLDSQEGTGYLGGQIPEDQMRAQLAKMIGATGDYGKAASVMFPREQEKTAMERNLAARGLEVGTPEYARAAEEYMTRTMVPSGVKAGRYGSVEAQGIIDQVEQDNVIDSVAKFSGPMGEAKRAAYSIGSALGVPDEDYRKYNTFVTTTVPALGSTVRKLLGDNPSVEQNKMIEKLVNPSSYTGSPELAKSRWNQLKDLHKIATKEIYMTPGELNKELSNILTEDNEVQNVPRGTSNEQNTITHGGKTYTREQLMRIAQGGR
jgi:hypothetical protein